MNYYEVLHITREADKPQIKRAYFSMVKAHSPDKDPEGFKAVRLAYETLYDDKKRAEYDAYFNASGDAQNELLTARELMRQNKYKEAADYLAALRVVKTNAENADIMRLQAEALLSCRKSGKAEDLCKAILAKNPRDIETMLLRASIAESRGHTNKAHTYYSEAVAIDPAYPKAWIQYMHYAIEHQPWRAKEVGIRALMINPEMFRTDYALYLRIICGDSVYCYSLLDDPEVISRVLLRAFGTFTECFLAEPQPEWTLCQITLFAITQVFQDPDYGPYIEKLLPAIEKCENFDKEDADGFNALRALMVTQKLHADKRIHDVLADLTGYLIEGKNDPEEKLSMETYIINELPGIRKDIKALREHYPEYFKLNQAFYMDALNDRKTSLLMEKYYSLYKRAQRGEDISADLAEADSDFDSSDTAAPYVREAPKVGRNDPCPCGSGKKYKKCCGR